METVVLVTHLLIAITLVGSVLLQRSEGGGLGMGGGGGGGGMGGFMTGRATANLLTRATAVLAAGFFLTSMTLAIMHSGNSKPTSILDVGAPAATEAPAPTPAEPAGPAVPLAQ
jgi:preprotein translocase subunit SecG